jgi:hypothetical protein
LEWTRSATLPITAAFKHVIMCERSPFEAVQTNILGVKNVLQAAVDNPPYEPGYGPPPLEVRDVIFG